MSSRQPHREPEVANSEGFPVKIILHERSTGDTQHDLEDGSEPDFSTTVALDMGLEICGRSTDRVVNPHFSTTGARCGAEVRMNSTNDEQCKHRDAANPFFSTTGAGNVGLEKNSQASQPVVRPFISTTGARCGAEVGINSRKDPALGSKTGVEPLISTIGAPQRGAGNDGKPSFSTTGATERGAKVSTESSDGTQRGFRDEAKPYFSTVLYLVC